MPIVVAVYPLLRDWTYRSTICKSKWFRVPWIVTLYGEVSKRNETQQGSLGSSLQRTSEKGKWGKPNRAQVSFAQACDSIAQSRKFVRVQRCQREEMFEAFD